MAKSKESRRTKRLRANIKDVLRNVNKEENPLSKLTTQQILDEINKKGCGEVMSILINVLPSDKGIVKCGKTKRKGRVYGKYDVTEWTLTEYVAAYIEDHLSEGEKEVEEIQIYLRDVGYDVPEPTLCRVLRQDDNFIPSDNTQSSWYLRKDE
jgi:hypothetical protein